MECYTDRKTLNLQMLQARNNISGRFTENTLSDVKPIISKYYIKNSPNVRTVIKRPLFEQQLTMVYNQAEKLTTAITKALVAY